ncbi:hypothetical protein [Lentzea sp. NPDC059081]|uniref:hypothetical protein n=1 Tax=Lentzea sp. NPDC059081 TaxID=3346719 RepID=UPI0036BED20E
MAIEYDARLQAKVIDFKKTYLGELKPDATVTAELWEALAAVAAGKPAKPEPVDESVARFVAELRGRYPELAALADLGTDEKALEDRFIELLLVDDELLNAVREVSRVADRMAAGPKGA